MQNHTLSIVVPCFNEEDSLPLFYREAQKAASELKTLLGYRTEYIFVDDGSSDSTLAILRELHETDNDVHYVPSLGISARNQLYARLKASQWRIHCHA